MTNLHKGIRFFHKPFNIIPRFVRISKFTNRLSRLEFRENMGILGLETSFFLSDRIFNAMDADSDSNVI